MDALGNVLLSGETAKQPSSTVTFSLTAPFAWTNNAGYDDDDGKSAFHVSPAAQVKATKKLRKVTLEGRASIGSDIYSRAEENNLSILQARFQLSVPDAIPLGRKPGSPAFTPYFRYRPKVEFSDAFFGKYDNTIHELSLGATTDISDLLPEPVSLELFVLRRESPDAVRERWQPGITVSMEGSFRDQNLGWSLEQSIQGRFFTGGTNDGREDLYSSTTAGITWKPSEDSPWKVTLVEATLEWNSSNFADRDYLVLNIGGGLSASF